MIRLQRNGCQENSVQTQTCMIPNMKHAIVYIILGAALFTAPLIAQKTKSTQESKASQSPLATAPGIGQAESKPTRAAIDFETPLGDFFYQKGRYDLAQIEYERQLKAPLKSTLGQSYLHSKLLLSLIRQRRFADASNRSISKEPLFAELYISLYASLRAEDFWRVSQKRKQILGAAHFSRMQKEQSLLLAGLGFFHPSYRAKPSTPQSVYYLNRLRERNFPGNTAVHLHSLDYYSEAYLYYAQLLKESTELNIRKNATQILLSLEEYQKKPKKKAYLASLYSAILPGSGQVYAEHYTDAILAFLYNFVSLGSAIFLYLLEQETHSPHYASVGMGILGLQFYISNIIGAGRSAKRYNDYQTRQVHQKIRTGFFNTDSIEQRSRTK